MDPNKDVTKTKKEGESSPVQRRKTTRLSKIKTKTDDSSESDVISAAELSESVDTPLDVSAAATKEEVVDMETESQGEVEDMQDVTDPVDERHCSLCNCGQMSLLGQGDLTRYEPTVNFHPFKKQLARDRSRRGSVEQDDKQSEKSNSPKHLTWRRARGPLTKPSRERSKSPRRVNPHNATDEQGNPVTVVDELSLVGHTDDIDVHHLFEDTGHAWAHHCCAAWSDGVIQNEDYTLQFVDKAVFAGMSQKCGYCNRYGATINCRASKCNKKYHYPCASGGGCFQDIKTLSLLCPDHSSQAEAIAGSEALCVVCDAAGQVCEQLFCTSCGQHYHGNCLDPPVDVNPVVRSGWQCPECKICQTCRHPGDDNKMLVCDTCDKGYHTFCLKPVMTTIPKNGWICKNCRVCGDCGARTPGSGPSSRWHLNYSVCDSCYQQRNKGLSCPMCNKAYRQFTQKSMAPCILCKRYVHNDCDESVDMAVMSTDEVNQYLCPVCKNRDPNDHEMPEPLVLSESLNTMINETDLKDLDMLSLFTKDGDTSSLKEDSLQGEEGLHSSQESLLLNEDSMSSMDIDFTLDKSSQQSSQSSTMSLLATASHRSHMRTGKGKPSYGKKRHGGASRHRPGKKNPRRLADGYRRSRHKGGRSRGRITDTSSVQTEESSEKKAAKEDDDHHATVVLCSAKDEYVLQQDMCMSCGCLGQGDEGKLIVCTQCGQCYHPCCVGVKPTEVVLKKGWRCLDCTVCEGCGQPHDESRLLLCDDCDISYHTYCLVPPLEHVPKGNWKCKWCVVCHTCGGTDPGTGCIWQSNYTQCGPCYSLHYCPACRRTYREEDLLMQCGHCDRWLHALCDGVRTEEEAERAIEAEYHCLYCRPKTGIAPPPIMPPSPEMPPSPPPAYVREPEPMPKPKPRFVVVDGVCLSESGMHQISNLFIPAPKSKRQRRSKQEMAKIKQEKSLPVEISSQKTDGLTPDGDFIEGREYDDIMDKEEESAKSEQLALPIVVPPVEGITILKKRPRPRKPQFRPGVGGFILKPKARTNVVRRTSVQAPDGASDTSAPRDLSPSKQADFGSPEHQVEHQNMEIPLSVEGQSVSDISLAATQADKRRRRKPAKKKVGLEETFPSYLQEAFFGKGLLDTTANKELVALDIPAEDKDVARSQHAKQDKGDTIMLISPPLQREASSGHHKESTTSEDIHNLDEHDLKDLLPSDLLAAGDLAHDEDLFGMIGEELSKDLSKETGDITDDAANAHTSERKTSISDSENIDNLLKENLDVDKILTEGLAQIDSQTLDDLFGGVSTSGQSLTSPSIHTSGDGHFQLPPLLSPPLPGSQGSGQSVQGHMTQGLDAMEESHSHHTSPASSQPVTPSGCLPQFTNQKPSSPFSDYHSVSPRLSPGFAGGWESNVPEEEAETLSCNKRNILKWEKDEPLGHMATISPVLFANIKYPELMHQYPDWTERAKQISRVWRKASTEEKAPFLLKAKENRALNRSDKLRKKQLMKSLKKKSPEMSVQMLPPPLPPPSKPLEEENDGSEANVMNKLAREQEQEQQWRHLQQIRHQQKQDLQTQFQRQQEMGINLPSSPHTNGAPGTQSHDPSAANYVLPSPRSDPYSSQPSTPCPDMKQPSTAPNTGLPIQLNPSGQPELKRQISDPNIHARGGILQRQLSDPALHRQGTSDPYARQPLTPRVEDPYSHQPGTPRVVPQDPYGVPPVHRLSSNQDPYPHGPRTPGPQPGMPIRPLVPSDPYNQPPGTPGEPYARPPGSPAASMAGHFGRHIATSGIASDPYSRQPSTPGSADPYRQQPPTPTSDPYIRPPLTPGSSHDPYAKAPGMPGDPYSRPSSTPRPQEMYTSRFPTSVQQMVRPPTPRMIGQQRPPTSQMMGQRLPGLQHLHMIGSVPQPHMLPQNVHVQQAGQPHHMVPRMMGQGIRAPDGGPRGSLRQSPPNEMSARPQMAPRQAGPRQIPMPMAHDPYRQSPTTQSSNLHSIIENAQQRFMDQDETKRMFVDPEGIKSEPKIPLLERLEKQAKERQMSKKDGVMAPGAEGWAATEGMTQGQMARLPPPGYPGPPGHFSPRVSTEQYGPRGPPEQFGLRPRGVDQFGPRGAEQYGPPRGPGPGDMPMMRQMMRMRPPAHIQPEMEGFSPHMMELRNRQPWPRGIGPPRGAFQEAAMMPRVPMHYMGPRPEMTPAERHRSPFLKMFRDRLQQPDPNAPNNPLDPYDHMPSTGRHVAGAHTVSTTQQGAMHHGMPPGQGQPEHLGLDDLLGVDGSFDILQYGDPDLELEVHDKNMFDEHLGLTKSEKESKQVKLEQGIDSGARLDCSEQKQDSSSVGTIPAPSDPSTTTADCTTPDATPTTTSMSNTAVTSSDTAAVTPTTTVSCSADTVPSTLEDTTNTEHQDSKTEKNDSENRESLEKMPEEKEKLTTPVDQEMTEDRNMQQAETTSPDATEINKQNTVSADTAPVESESLKDKEEIKDTIEKTSVDEGSKESVAAKVSVSGKTVTNTDQRTEKAADVTKDNSGDGKVDTTAGQSVQSATSDTPSNPEPQSTDVANIDTPAIKEEPQEASLSDLLSKTSKIRPSLEEQLKEDQGDVKERVQTEKEDTTIHAEENSENQVPEQPPTASSLPSPLYQTLPGQATYTTASQPAPATQAVVPSHTASGQSTSQHMPGIDMAGPNGAVGQSVGPNMARSNGVVGQSLGPKMGEPSGMAGQSLGPNMAGPGGAVGLSHCPNMAGPSGMAGQSLELKQEQLSPGSQRPEASCSTLLLKEQPLILADMLEQVNQERLEQQRQAQQQVLIQKKQEGLISEEDFEKLKVELMPEFSQKGMAPPAYQSVPPRMPGQGMERLQRPPHPGDHQQWPQGRFPMPLHGEAMPHQGFHGGQFIGHRPPQAGQMHPRTPSPFSGPMYRGSHSPALQSPGPLTSPGAMTSPGIMTSPMPSGHIQTPPIPPQGHAMSESERHQQMQYEEWLMQHTHLLQIQISYLEQRITKQKKVKKVITHKQKQMRKVSKDLTDSELDELEQVTQAASLLQKQMDQVKKQHKQHQGLVQDYRAKQQERFGNQWPSPGLGSRPPHSPMGPPPSPMMPHPLSPMLTNSPSPMMPQSPSPMMPHPSAAMMPHSPATMMPQGPMMAQSQAPMMSQASMMSQGHMISHSQTSMMQQASMMSQPTMIPHSQSPMMPHSQMPARPHSPRFPLQATGPMMTGALSPRIPGAHSAPVRMTPKAKLEYDAYVQSRIRQQQQGPNPLDALTPPAGPLSQPPSPKTPAVLVKEEDNNPFSDSYIQREHFERIRTQAVQRPQMTGPQQMDHMVSDRQIQQHMQHPGPYGMQGGPPPGMVSPRAFGPRGPRYQQQMVRLPMQPGQFGHRMGHDGLRMPVDESHGVSHEVNQPIGMSRSGEDSTSYPLPANFPSHHEQPQAMLESPDKTKKKRKRRKKSDIQAEQDSTDMAAQTQQTIDDILAAIPQSLHTDRPRQPTVRQQLLPMPSTVVTPSVLEPGMSSVQMPILPDMKKEMADKKNDRDDKTDIKELVRSIMDADRRQRDSVPTATEMSSLVQQGIPAVPSTMLLSTGGSSTQTETTITQSLSSPVLTPIQGGSGKPSQVLMTTSAQRLMTSSAAPTTTVLDERRIIKKKDKRPQTPVSYEKNSIDDILDAVAHHGKGEVPLKTSLSLDDVTMDTSESDMPGVGMDSMMGEAVSNSDMDSLINRMTGEQIHRIIGAHEAQVRAIQQRLAAEAAAGNISASQALSKLASVVKPRDGVENDDRVLSVLRSEAFNDNTLLKKLLNTPRHEDGEGEEDMIQLTEEQQRQLALIESMPLIREKELDWSSTTPEERELIQELKRRELAEKAAILKRKSKSKKTKDGATVPPTKKRQKKTGAKSEEDGILHVVMQRLRMLPSIALQEPALKVTMDICPLMGSADIASENQLKGTFGHANIPGLPDYFSHFPFTRARPSLSASNLAELAHRRRFLSDSTMASALASLSDQQRYRLMTGDQVSPSAATRLVNEYNIQQKQKQDSQARKKVDHSSSRSNTPQLPTPPLVGERIEVLSRSSNTPDTIVSASSPEFTQEDIEKFSGIKLIDPEQTLTDDRNPSPDIPIVVPVPIRACPIKEEELDKKDEDIINANTVANLLKLRDSLPAPMPDITETVKDKVLSSAFGEPLQEEDKVSVTLTLSAQTAEDVHGVIVQLSNILNIAVPKYETVSSPGPDQQFKIKHQEEKINIQTLKSKQKFCRHCDVVVLNSGISKKVSEMPFLTSEEREMLEEDEVMFCSMNCYMQFAKFHRSGVSTSEVKREAGNIVEHKTSTPDDKSLISVVSPPIKRSDVKRRRSSTTSLDSHQPSKPVLKKWKGLKWKHWDITLSKSIKKLYKPHTDAEIFQMIEQLEIIIRPSKSLEDNRMCEFCYQEGDGLANGPARLLNMDVDKWAHLNCALWSYEVYETCNGSLMNVEQAHKRGLSMECVYCRKTGATVGCFKLRCTNVYHVPCAQEVNVMFFKDKTILCPIHMPKGIGPETLESLSVDRKVYINRDENLQLVTVIHQEDKSNTIRIGALTYHNIGQLLPHQIATGRFHTRDHIYPVGYKASRFYWSMRRVNKRCRYQCSIADRDGRPEFSVTIMESGFDDVTLVAGNPKEVWMNILNPLEKLRKTNDLVKMFPAHITGEDMFGLTEPAIVRVIESLPGTDLLTNYAFKFGRKEMIEMPLAINPTGCARSEPKMRTHFRRPHLQTTSASHVLPSTVTGVWGDVNSPYMKQFIHSKSQQYRRLKTEWRNLVYLGRSRIQGLGLYASRDIEKHTMVIEYIGETIRNELAEMREKQYEQQNRGVYMFRISDNQVVDATMSGGPARYINHSCNPNCVAEVVPFEKESKIIIIANRRIARGEELTYDYKFDLEDDQHKIPCCCGASNCQKWMN